MTAPLFLLQPGEFEFSPELASHLSALQPSAVSAQGSVSLEAAMTACSGWVSLRGEEARHALEVKRLKAGEILDLSDGRGLRLRARLGGGAGRGVAGSGGAGSAGDRGGRAERGEHKERGVLRAQVFASILQSPPPPALVLVQALAKNKRDEQAVETATEIGVSEIIPWQAARCVTVWSDAKKAEKGREKWEKIAAEATKQSRQAFIPQVSPLLRGEQLYREITQRVARGAWALALHESATEPFSAWAKRLQEAFSAGDFGRGENPAPPETDAHAPGTKDTGTDDTGTDDTGGAHDTGARLEGRAGAPTEIILLVGPEGGISEEEIAALRQAGAQALRLGQSVLRASTAGPAALAALHAASGRWD